MKKTLLLFLAAVLLFSMLTLAACKPSAPNDPDGGEKQNEPPTPIEPQGDLYEEGDGGLGGDGNVAEGGDGTINPGTTTPADPIE